MSDDNFDPAMHYRRTDPPPSQDAAEEVSRRGTVLRHKRALAQAHWDLIQQRRYHGLTARETAEAAGVEIEAAHKRCSDLLRDHTFEWWKAEEGDRADREGFLIRRNPGSNSWARVLVLTPQGARWVGE